MRNVIVLAAIVMALASCATTPRQSAQLDEAHAQVQALSQALLARQAAEEDLRAAQNRLQEADNALQQGKPFSSVDQLAYLAERHAEAATARVQAATAREAVARAHTDVLFDTGAATLKPGAELPLDRLADYFKSHPQSKVLIEGQTDSRGSDEYNDALSTRRAQAVASSNSLGDSGRKLAEATDSSGITRTSSTTGSLNWKGPAERRGQYFQERYAEAIYVLLSEPG